MLVSEVPGVADAALSRMWAIWYWLERAEAVRHAGSWSCARTKAALARLERPRWAWVREVLLGLTEVHFRLPLITPRCAAAPQCILLPQGCTVAFCAREAVIIRGKWRSNDRTRRALWRGLGICCRSATLLGIPIAAFCERRHTTPKAAARGQADLMKSSRSFSQQQCSLYRLQESKRDGRMGAESLSRNITATGYSNGWVRGPKKAPERVPGPPQKSSVPATSDRSVGRPRSSGVLTVPQRIDDEVSNNNTAYVARVGRRSRGIELGPGNTPASSCCALRWYAGKWIRPWVAQHQVMVTLVATTPPTLADATWERTPNDATKTKV